MTNVVRRSLRDEVEEALWRQGAEAAYAGERTMRGGGYAKNGRSRDRYGGAGFARSRAERLGVGYAKWRGSRGAGLRREWTLGYRIGGEATSLRRVIEPCKPENDGTK
jgi:hypothetical protein